MTSPAQFHVFLSAVSSEFQLERVQLETWIERKGLHVSSQEKFNQGGSTLWQKLHDEMARCQAVVCIVGVESGWPSSGELPDGAPERSWTQWEFWLAWGEKPWSPPRRDKVFIFFPVDLEQRMEKVRIAAAGDKGKLHALELQQRHIKQVKGTGKHYGTFVDADDLIKQCLVLDLPTIARQKPSNLRYGTLGSLFKGREQKLDELHRRIMAGTGVRQVVHGLGGTGKTRLAVEYALRHSEKYQALLLVPADTSEVLNRNLATLCGPLILDLPEQETQEEAARYRAILRWFQSHQDWLLIIDNVDTTSGAKAVEELVGNLRSGTVLITSRLADWSSEMPALELEELTESSAVEFLLERTQNKRHCLPTDVTDAQALAGELGCLPLALEQAGAFIAQKRSSVAHYLARWRQRDERVRQWNDERLTKYPRCVVTTWDTTVEQLSPEGQALLRQVSWLAPEPIPRSLLPEGPAQEALAEIASFSLAKFDESGGQFRIHRLVLEVTRDRQSNVERDQSLRAMLATFHQTECGAPQDVRSWPIWDPLRPHLATVTTHADQEGITEPTARLMNQLGLLFLAKARYAEAEPLMKRALAIDEASYGAEHPNVAIRLNNLASLLQDTNRLGEAESLMRRALAIDEASYGLEDRTVARDLNNLALLLKDTNRLKDAELLIRRALAIDEASYGLEHPVMATNLNSLAQLLQVTNRLEEAESLMRRALAINEANYGLEHPAVATNLNNLALLLHVTNRLEQAEPLMRRALAIDEASYGVEHSRVGTRLNNLARLLQEMNRLGEAERLMRRAVLIFLAFTHTMRHPHLKQVCGSYSRLLLAMELSNDEITQRLVGLGAEAGFDDETFRTLLAELFS